MEIIKQSPKVIDRVSSFLKRGGVVICPTDTVYGFLAEASNKKAVNKIFEMKKRLKSKALPVFVKDLKMIKDIAFVDQKQKKFISKFWPGKYTFILKKKKGKKFYGVSQSTIAIRIPKYKFLNNLLKKINRPLVQTSVNLSGESSLTKIGDIIDKFSENEDILMIDAGNLKKSKPSKIIDLASKYPTRLR